MLVLVTTLNEALPELEAESDLFQCSNDLQFQLQDLYDIYMDYCIECIQFVKRSPAGPNTPPLCRTDNFTD
jgi:hypothetical protein